MTKSSVLLRRNKGYFRQKVAKTLFGNSPLMAKLRANIKVQLYDSACHAVGTAAHITIHLGFCKGYLGVRLPNLVGVLTNVQKNVFVAADGKVAPH